MPEANIQGLLTELLSLLSSQKCSIKFSSLFTWLTQACLTSALLGGHCHSLMFKMKFELQGVPGTVRDD